MTLKDLMIEDIDLGITKTNELIKQINLIEKLNDKDKENPKNLFGQILVLAWLF
mgnify:CR=1 FL=1